jgi:serine/threonine protein kinase
MIEMNTLQRGTQAGGFVILRRIGSGGQADVYLACPTHNGRRADLAALKIARPDHAAGLHDEHGWLTGPEADHPSLTRLYSRRRDGPACISYVDMPGQGRSAFLALAYAPGITLELLLARRRGRGLPAELATHIALRTASALSHLHRRVGIIHHDVRPANLIIGPGRPPQVTLIDLGAAESPTAPRRRWVYGTGAYLPPERLAGAEVSPQVDIYSLGLVLRAMLGGQPAPPALASLIRDATADDPHERAAALPDMAAMHGRLEVCP